MPQRLRILPSSACPTTSARPLYDDPPYLMPCMTGALACPSHPAILSSTCLPCGRTLSVPEVSLLFRGLRYLRVRFFEVSSAYTSVRSTARRLGVLRLASSIGVCQGARTTS